MAKSKTIELTAKTRERLGSRYAARVRKQGGLPAVLYGHGETPAPLTLDARETLRHINEGKRVFSLKIEGAGQAETALLRDIQFDHLGTHPIHIDLSRVSLNERVHVKVHITMKGEAVGLKTAGAVLIHPMTELDVRCMVTDIVDHVDLDISDLAVGGVKHASDVVLPEGFELLTDPNAVVASIQLKVEEAAPEAAAVEGEAAQPEVLTAKKPEAGAAAAGKDAKKK